jgi:hypothetical protein
MIVPLDTFVDEIFLPGLDEEVVEFNGILFGNMYEEMLEILVTTYK